MLKHVLILTALITGAGASAQTVPNSPGDPLQEICTGFLAQSGAGVSGDPAKLCTCLVTETQKRLTLEEMVAYHSATSMGREPPPAVMQKVMAIATQCLTQR